MRPLERRYESHTMSRLLKLQQLLADDPSDPFLHYAVAMEQVKLGEHDAALEQLTAINRQFPEYVAAWQQHGQLLADRGETDSAREILRQGIAAAQNAGDAHAAGEMQGLIDLLPSGW
jgi:predicted Zn-dependent protease